MEEIGQRRSVLVAGTALGFGGAALVAAALACALAWPFAIDDAFIGVRYARHLRGGAGYVWNAGGPATDGVTPLPWAFLLAPLARAAADVVLWRARLAGALAWTLTAAAWGGAVGRAKAPAWVKASAVALLAVSVPVAAHAVSGMETAFATALATAAAIAHRRPRVAAALAGLAATLRPELVVWGVVASVGLALATGSRRSRLAGAPRGHALAELAPTVLAGALAVLPFVACAGIRLVAFGRAAPLSVLAKPSDLAHGLAYAGAAALFSLAPVVVLCPVALARERGPALALVVAGLAHFVVIVAVGGDWMPFARLAAPVIPSLLLAFVLVAPHATPGIHAARAALALVLAVRFVPASVQALRRAGHDRSAMIEAARPLLVGAGTTAAVDIGWVSDVSEAPILDLAGVTDPEVAALGGGHTSKRVDPAYLLARDVETAVFYADPLPSSLAGVTPQVFPRVVEARLASSEAFVARFAPAALLPLGERGAGYVIYRRR